MVTEDFVVVPQWDATAKVSIQLQKHCLKKPGDLGQRIVTVVNKPGGAMSVIPCLTSFNSDSFLSCLSGFNLEKEQEIINTLHGM